MQNWFNISSARQQGTTQTWYQSVSKDIETIRAPHGYELEQFEQQNK